MAQSGGCPQEALEMIIIIVTLIYMAQFDTDGTLTALYVVMGTGRDTGRLRTLPSSSDCRASMAGKTEEEEEEDVQQLLIGLVHHCAVKCL